MTENKAFVIQDIASFSFNRSESTYLNFLKCFAKLDTEEIVERRKLVEDMKTFFDREQCLRCVDSGMRREVL